MGDVRASLRYWSLALCAIAGVAVCADAFGQQQGCRLARKIVGGYPAKIEHWPGFAALRLYHPDKKLSLYFCGGAAISPGWVVTAAHCFNDLEGMWRAVVSRTDDFSRVRLQIVLGTDNLDTATNDNIFETQKWFQHEVYASALAAAKAGPNPELAESTAERVGHDIALVKLAGTWNGPLSRLSLTDATDPVLPVPADQPVMVAGFGSTHPESGDIRPFTRSSGEKYFASTPELLEVALPFVDSAMCHAEWPSANIGTGQVCAGFDKGRGKDSCNGDSGGPLVTLDEHLCPRQIGLVSWGPSPCAPDQKAYGVYTRISAFASWLKEHVPGLK